MPTGKIDRFWARRLVGAALLSIVMIIMTGSKVEGTLVQAYVDHVRVDVHGDREIVFRGEVVLSGDGLIPVTQLNIAVTLKRVDLVATSEPHHVTLQSGWEVTHFVEVEKLPETVTNSVRAAFEATIALEFEPQWPYQLWNAVLEPQLLTTVPTAVTPHKEKFRVYAQGPPKPSHRLRVMTYNIRRGMGMDGETDLQRLADVMAYAGADIIGLQEVDVGVARSGRVDQARTLADMLHMHYVFEANLPFQGGLYGNALLSRYPIVEAQNIRLPYRLGEPRGLLHAQVDLHGTPLDVLVTHLGFYGDNVRQRNYIVDYVSQLNHPFVLLGDFNSDPFDVNPRSHDVFLDGSSVHRESGDGSAADVLKDAPMDAGSILAPIVRDAWLELMVRHGKGLDWSANTYSSINPTRRIDYIFISKGVTLVDEQSVFMIQSKASDHLPVVAHIQVGSEERESVPFIEWMD